MDNIHDINFSLMSTNINTTSQIFENNYNQNQIFNIIDDSNEELNNDFIIN